MATATQPPLSGLPLQSYLVAEASKRKLDPAAVLAVAVHEGGFSGAVGDSGTSFGPFQLHKGGRLPPSITNPQQWANTPDGLNYALDGIAAVAAGQSGNTAIENIVRRFEQPADPASEVAASETTYAALRKTLQTTGLYPDLTQNSSGSFADPNAGVKSAAAQTFSAITSVADALKFLFSTRGLEVIGGGALILIGVISLARSAGINLPAPGPAAAAAAAL